MAKYHINGKGEPGPCRAEKACPFGGEESHYPTADAARAAFEESQPTFAADSTAPSELTSVREQFATFNERSYDKGDNEVIRKLTEGKKVTDAAFDKMLEGIRKRSIYRASSPEANNLWNSLKKLREERGTPSTLPTVDSFDPATQSVMSNPQARSHVSVAMKVLRNELSHEEHMRSRQGMYNDDEVYAPFEEHTPEKDAEAAESMALYSYFTLETQRSRARIGAIVKEISWLQKNGKFQDDGPSVPLEQLQSGVQAKGTDHFNGTLRKVKP